MLMMVVIGILVLQKKIKITPVFAGRFEIRGVDVSHYQGTIDWPILVGQDLDFAYIKATEGSSHVDECFADNWQEAGKTDLYIGAYHFSALRVKAQNRRSSISIWLAVCMGNWHRWWMWNSMEIKEVIRRQRMKS